MDQGITERSGVKSANPMRSRNIKPSTFSNEVLGVADPYLTILFAGLWCLADREGRLEDRPLKIKGQIFPYRNFSETKMNEFLSWLETHDFIRRYQADCKRVIQVVRFLDHQSPHSTEKESQLAPEPERLQQDAEQRNNNESITQTYRNSGISGIRNQESEIRNQELGISAEIFAYWQAVHNKPQAQFTVERKRKVSERLKDSTLAEIKLAIDGCKMSALHQGQNDRGTVYNDLELICRTRTHLEKFINYTQQTNGTNNGHHQTNSTRATNLERLAATQAVLDQYPTEAELRGSA